MHIIFLFLLLFTSCSSIKNNQNNLGTKIHPLPHGSKHAEKFYSEVYPYFAGKKVVQLGEAIHMTKELPLARLEILPVLARQNFDLVLFEGSTIEAWLAADYLLKNSSPQDKQVVLARDVAFPGIWRTAEYTRILKWLQSSWKTSAPIYLASYDVQPGMGSLKENALPEFLQILESYATVPAQSKMHKKRLALLSNRKHGFPNKPLSLSTKKEIEASIDWLDRWINSAEPVLSQRYPFVPHGRLLRQIPSQLRRQTELWLEHSRDPKKAQFLVFQETRDKLAAKAILELTDKVSPNRKSIVWAHHVHVFHNSLGKSRHSLGYDLKESLGDRLYTIGTFAGSGESFSLDMDDVQPSVLKPLEANSLEGILQKLSSEEFFVDFNVLGDPALNIERTTYIEGVAKRDTVPTKDFDAAIFIHKVSRPKPFWEK